MFSERLKLLRKSRQLSQVRLAQLLGMDPRSYNRWERGGNAPHLDWLIKIADILQVSLDELVCRTNSISPIKVQNPELQQLLQQADQLSVVEQEALVCVLDAMLKKAEISRVLKPET